MNSRHLMHLCFILVAGCSSTDNTKILPLPENSANTVLYLEVEHMHRAEVTEDMIIVDATGSVTVDSEGHTLGIPQKRRVVLWAPFSRPKYCGYGTTTFLQRLRRDAAAKKSCVVFCTEPKREASAVVSEGEQIRCLGYLQGSCSQGPSLDP